MNGIYLIIGGNMGERQGFLRQARLEIAKQIGTITQQSHIYETASWGQTDQHAFLNQVLLVDCSMSAREVLNTCLEIEKKMGRIRELRWGSRIIDIDILFYNQEIIHEENLKIPHPHLQERKFVLVPLNEIAPAFVHPELHKTVSRILSECIDDLDVRIVEN